MLLGNLQQNKNAPFLWWICWEKDPSTEFCNEEAYTCRGIWRAGNKEFRSLLVLSYLVINYIVKDNVKSKYLGRSGWKQNEVKMVDKGEREKKKDKRSLPFAMNMFYLYWFINYL